MKSRFLFWSFILILSLVLSGLCLRVSALRGTPASDALLVRGLFSLLFTFVFAAYRGLSLRPRSVRTQIFRAGIAGLALTFFAMSYDWLSASAISVLSNIDVPFLLILGPLVGVRATMGTRGLAVLSVLFLVLYVTAMKIDAGTAVGLASLGLGTVLLCFGFFYIKKSMNEENEAITVLTPSLAIIGFGLAHSFFAGGIHLPASPSEWTEAVVSGGSMFGAYYATMRLYEVTDLANAEFPTLLAAIAIQPLEFLLLGEPIETAYLISSVGFVITTYFILHRQNRAETVRA